MPPELLPQFSQVETKKKGNLRLVLIGLALVVAGFAAAEAPSLFLDLMFLHEARLQNEMNIRAQNAARAIQPVGGKIDQSQVHPADPPK